MLDPKSNERNNWCKVLLKVLFLEKLCNCLISFNFGDKVPCTKESLTHVDCRYTHSVPLGLGSQKAFRLLYTMSLIISMDLMRR